MGGRLMRADHRLRVGGSAVIRSTIHEEGKNVAKNGDNRTMGRIKRHIYKHIKRFRKEWLKKRIRESTRGKTNARHHRL